MYLLLISSIRRLIRNSLTRAYVNATTDDIQYNLHRASAERIKDVLRYSECIFSAEIDNNDICEKLMEDLFESSGPSWRDISQGAIDEWENGEAEVVLKGAVSAQIIIDFPIRGMDSKKQLNMGIVFLI